MQTSPFAKKLRGAGKTLKSFTKRVAGGAAKVVKWGAALTAAAVGGVALIIRKQLAAIDTLAKFSAAIGISVNALQAQRLAASIAGIEIDKLDKANKRMIKSVSDGVNGLSTAVRAFDALGLEAEDLQNLAPDEIFKRIADAVQEAGNNVKTLGAVMDIFGARNGAELINLLKQGREGIERFEREVDALGLGLSRVDVAQVEAANDAMTRAKALLGGIAQRLTVEVAPFLEAAVNKFVKMGSEGTTAGVFITNAVEKIAKGVAFVTNMVQAWTVGWQIMKANVALALAVVVSQLGLVAKVLNFITGVFGAETFQWVEDLNAFAAAARSTALDELKILGEKFDALANNPWGDEVIATFEDIKRAAREAGEQAAKAAEDFNDIGSGIDDAAGELEKMRREAERIKEDILTPLERFVRDKDRLKALLDADLLTLDQYQLALKKIAEEFNRVTEAAKGLAKETPSIDEPKIGEFRQVDSIRRLALQGVRSGGAEGEANRLIEQLNEDFNRRMRELDERLRDGIALIAK